METGIQLWNKTLSTVLDMPGVKVDRASFIRKALKSYCNETNINKAINARPSEVLSKDKINHIARQYINSHLTKVTLISAAAGVPGGFALIATVPGDVAQYYYHVFVLSQKLAYLYGIPDLCDEDGNVSENMVSMMTIFAGVMSGVAAANQGLRLAAQQLSKQAARKLPQQALTKGTVYPIIKQVSKILGIQMNKNIFGKGVSKMIPFIGGFTSGSLTYAMFRLSAIRLQKVLFKEMDYFTDDPDKNREFLTNANYVDLQEAEVVEESLEEISIKICINMALIDNNPTKSEIDFITNDLHSSTLNEGVRKQLLENLSNGISFKINYDMLRENDNVGIQIMNKLLKILSLDNRYTLSEKLYLKKVANYVGLSPEDYKDFIS